MVKKILLLAAFITISYVHGSKTQAASPTLELTKSPVVQDLVRDITQVLQEHHSDPAEFKTAVKSAVQERVAELRNLAAEQVADTAIAALLADQTFNNAVRQNNTEQSDISPRRLKFDMSKFLHHTRHTIIDETIRSTVDNVLGGVFGGVVDIAKNNFGRR